MSMETQTVSTRLPVELVEQIDRYRDVRSRNAFVVNAIERYVREQRIAEMCKWARRTGERDEALAEEFMGTLDEEYDDE